MAPQFTESEDGIDYRGESLSPLARLFILLMAAAMFVVPAFLIALVPWTAPTWSTFMAVVGIVGFAAVGATFAWMGLAPLKAAVFDARTRVLHMRLRGPLGRRERRWPFTAIESIVVRRSRGMEDPDLFQIRMKLANRKRPYDFGMFGVQHEAEAWQLRLESLLSTDGRAP